MQKTNDASSMGGRPQLRKPPPRLQRTKAGGTAMETSGAGSGEAADSGSAAVAAAAAIARTRGTAIMAAAGGGSCGGGGGGSSSGGADLRSKILGLHNKMKSKWGDQNRKAGHRLITRILREEVDGLALLYALEMLMNGGSSAGGGVGGITVEEALLVRRVVQDVRNASIVEFYAELHGEEIISTLEVHRLQELVREHMQLRFPSRPLASLSLPAPSSPSLSRQSSPSGSLIDLSSIVPPSSLLSLVSFSTSTPRFPFQYHIVANTNKGVRAANEDTFIVIEHFNELLGLEDGAPQLYIGLFDGHSGKHAADFCRAHLHINISKDKHFDTDLEKALIGGFIKTDKQFNDKAEVNGLNDGTTAMAIFISQDRILVGNCGDAKAILLRGNEEVVELCTTQNPDREDERERVKRAGGTVVWWGTWRVNGVLAVSRSIGDKHLKDICIAEPELRSTQLAPGDQFLVAATDGLWDVMDGAMVAATVRKTLQEKGPLHVPDALIQEALAKNAKDNVTVVTVLFSTSA
ncbi:Protein phosphatase 1E [Balamuthia mandrillaris]